LVLHHTSISSLTMTDTAPMITTGVAIGKEVTYVTGSMVEVTAPADLQEGYVLPVNVHGSASTVTVPAGGVKEGESFQAQPTSEGVQHFIPTGNWRDGLCDWCKFGCCHAMCWLGWCFEPILAGQVMQRMSLSWMGGKGQRPSASNTCKIVTGIFFGVAVLQSILRLILQSQGSCSGELEIDENGKKIIKCFDGSTETPNSAYVGIASFSSILGSLFAVYLFFAICQTRAAMRRKYNIATGDCGGMEDCCCTYFCSCCVVQQMARHTNDYANHDVDCCSAACLNTRGQDVSLPEIEIDP